MWMRNDVGGYAGWLNKQKNPGIYQEGASQLVSHLKQEEAFEEALDWAQSAARFQNAELPPQRQRVIDTYQSWYQSDPKGAKAWKINATLAPEHRESIDKWEQSQNASDQ